LKNKKVDVFLDTVYMCVFGN